MKNLKKGFNLFVLVVFVSFEILSSITYAVEDNFVETGFMVVENGIGDENPENSEESYTLQVENTGVETGDSIKPGAETIVETGDNVDIVGVLAEDGQDEDMKGEKLEEEIDEGSETIDEISENAVEIFTGDSEIYENLVDIMEGNESEEKSGLGDSENDALDSDTELEAIVDNIQLMGLASSITIIHNANGGQFSDESEEKVAVYSGLGFGGEIKKYSHTQNINDAGVKQSNYSNNWTNSHIRGSGRTSANSDAHVITIPHATKLKIIIEYGGESTSYDWVCMWTGSHPTYTAASNCSTSVSGKLGGTHGTRTYEVIGDTVTFAFRTDGSGIGDGYGYYAVVEGEGYTTEENVLPKNAGYGFMGWTKNVGGEGEIVGGVDDNGRGVIFTEVEDNSTLYAKWDACYNYDVTSEENKEVKLSRYSTYCNGNDIEIPEVVDGYTVTEIGDNVFKDRELNSLIMPDTIRKIGQYAFYNSKLSEIDLPSSLVNIGQYAFYNNKLTEVELPSTLTDIGSSAFYSNQLTGKLVIPEGVTNIGQYAFYSNKLVELELPSTLTGIGQNVFYGNQLTGKLVIPQGVEEIGYSAFYNNKLTEVELPVSLTRIGEYAFQNNQLTGKLVIPEGVTNIGRYAFYGNRLNMVDLPVTLKSIGSYAFCNNASYPVIAKTGNGWTYELQNDECLALEEDCYSISKYSDGSAQILSYNAQLCGTEVEVPEVIYDRVVRNIGPGAFSGQGITSIKLPDTVTYIDSYAFANNQIGNVSLGLGVKTIGSNAFMNNNIKEIELPKSLNNIYFGAFLGNTSIPVKGIRKIGTQGLYNGDSSNIAVVTSGASLESLCFVVNGNTITNYNAGFEECSSDVIIPSEISGVQITTIGGSAFYNKGITSVVIPDTITNIGNQAFQYNALKEIVIPGSVTSIGNRAFYGNQLLELDIPNSVTSVGNNAFCGNKSNPVIGYREAGMSGLVNNAGSCLAVRVDENDDTCYEITSTGMITRYYGGVRGCNIGLVEIPSAINGVQVNSIGSNAFNNMGITGVIIPEGVITINSNAFSNNQLKTLTLPSTITTIQLSAFSNNTFSPVIGYVLSTGGITNDVSSTYIKLVTQEMIDALSGCFSFDSEKGEILDYYAGYKEECGENVEVPSEIDGVQVKSIGTGAFKNKGIESLLMPEGIEEINQDSFYGNKLFKVELSDTIKSIGGNAFCYQNGGLGKVYAVRDNGSGGIEMLNNTCLYFVESGASLISEGCYEFNKERGEIIRYNIGENCGTDVNIPSEIDGVQVKSIGDYAFYNKGITSLNIPECVEKIGNYAFQCHVLQKLVIPGSVKEVGYYAFNSCSQYSLQEVEIKEGVEVISGYAFTSNRLSKLILPDSLRVIGNSAFGGYHSLTSINIPNSLERLENGAFINFSWNRKVLGITMNDPSNIEIIGEPYVNLVRGYSVTFDTQGGTEIEEQVYVPGSTINIPANPTKTGYNFEGWEPEMPQEMPKQDLVFIAKWKSPKSGGGGGGGGSSSDKTEDKNQDKEQQITVEQQEINTGVVEKGSGVNTGNTQKLDEIEESYRWAYAHDVTTMSTLQKANPDGVVKRGHMAKMVVNFVVNVMGKEEPKEIPAQCSRGDELKERESDEIKGYAEKACALGIMGINVKTFAPNRVVTRAEFGTILSRILRGNKYDVEKASKENPYYKKHLEVLKAEGIMTQIENPTKREEKRKWVRVMLSRVEIEK